MLIALSCDTKWGISEQEISVCFKDDIKKDLEQLGISAEHFSSLPDLIQLRITTVYRSGRFTLSISAQEFIQVFILGHDLSWQVLDYLEDYDFSLGESEYLLLGDLSRETLIKTHSSPQGGLNLIHETAGLDDSASLPL
jgi:hypothetical protein